MTTSFLTRTSLLLATATLLLGAGCVTTSPTTPSSIVPGSPTATYTLIDVAQHKDATSCWTVVRGKVYDVTTWIGQHPGGAEAIRSMCGQDASAAFMDQHDGQREPEKELAGFQIGVTK